MALTQIRRKQLGSGSVGGHHLGSDLVTGLDALGSAALHQTQDYFLFSDNGTPKKVTFSNVEDSIFANVSGDATIAAGGALTIAANSVEGSMLNDNCISGQSNLGGVGVDDADEFMFSDAGTLKALTGANLYGWVFSKVSGDATVNSAGALTIAAGAVENSMLADDAVGADELAANAVVNASIASNAAIDLDKLDGGSCASSLSDLAQGDLIYAGDVDDSNNIKSITFSNLEDAIFGNVSGDATIAAGGALTIAADAVEPSMINVLDDSLAATDTHFLIADGTDYSSFALSGDVTCTNAGVVTIAAGAVENSMLANDSVTIGSTECDLGSTTTAFAGLTGLNFAAADASIAAGIGANTLTVGGSTTEVKVPGNLTVQGTLVTLDVTSLAITGSIILEGSSADGYETTVSAVDPTADRTVYLPNQTGYLPVLAVASTTAVTSTPEELNLMDGATTAGTTAVAGGDGIVTNDGGTMRQTTVDTFDTYLAGTTKTLTNKTLTSPVINAATCGTSLSPSSANAVPLGGATAEWADLYLGDQSVVYFGNDQEVTLTHVPDGGVVLNSSMAMMFGDNATVIKQVSDSNLEVEADGSIILDSPVVDFQDDGAILKFGDDSEVTLTHVHNTGLLLSDDSGIGTTQLQFGDSGTYVHQSGDGVLGLVADGSITLTAGAGSRVFKLDNNAISSSVNFMMPYSKAIYFDGVETLNSGGATKVTSAVAGAGLQSTGSKGDLHISWVTDTFAISGTGRTGLHDASANVASTRQFLAVSGAADGANMHATASLSAVPIGATSGSAGSAAGLLHRSEIVANGLFVSLNGIQLRPSSSIEQSENDFRVDYSGSAWRVCLASPMETSDRLVVRYMKN